MRTSDRLGSWVYLCSSFWLVSALGTGWPFPHTQKYYHTRLLKAPTRKVREH